MKYSVSKLKMGVGASAAKLREQGITSTDVLLKQSATPEQREALAAKIGLTKELVLELANRADLARLKGVGPVYSNLLEVAGVDTVVELSKRVPANLHEKLSEISASKGVKRAPTLAEVESWVSQAKSAGRVIRY
jgi:predicted flap endonuclease-1-like 5' DNA nuclease